MKTRPASLVTIVARRILLFAALASLLQAGVVFADYWFDDEELGRIVIERETARIRAAVLAAEAGEGAFPGADLVARYGLDRPGSGYLLRVREGDGDVTYSNCDGACLAYFLPVQLASPGFWQRSLAPGRPLSVAGGRLFPDDADEGGHDDEAVIVEFAAVGDPNHLVNAVMLHEMMDHLVVPMGLMLFVVIGATLLSIRRALGPVALAAESADAIDPTAVAMRLPTAQMPREIAALTEAVNRAFERIGALVRSQRIFAASVAHEIRTPLAILRLELDRVDDPRARRAEQTIDSLTHTLEQLTALSRLDAIDPAAFVRRDLAELVRGAVEEITPLVYARGKRVEFEEAATPTVTVLPGIIETLVRNLVENAIKHTVAGTLIRVSVRGPAVLEVSEDGGGADPAVAGVAVELGQVKRSGALGLGLKIVERIAALHGADLVVTNRPGEGMTVAVAFPPAV